MSALTATDVGSLDYTAMPSTTQSLGLAPPNVDSTGLDYFHPGFGVIYAAAPGEDPIPATSRPVCFIST